jgi:hypothetical protein
LIFFGLFGPFYTNIQAFFSPKRPFFGSGIVISQKVIDLQGTLKIQKLRLQKFGILAAFLAFMAFEGQVPFIRVEYRIIVDNFECFLNFWPLLAFKDFFWLMEFKDR